MWRPRQPVRAGGPGSATPRWRPAPRKKRALYAADPEPACGRGDLPVRCIDLRIKLDGAGARRFSAPSRSAWSAASRAWWPQPSRLRAGAGVTACGWVSRFARIAPPTSWVHLADRRLRCHHCGCDGPIPRACPSAATRTSSPSAAAPSASEARLAELFPLARVLRVDRDAARTRSQWEAPRHHRRRRGRHPRRHQMMAKGHDFPQAHPGRGGGGGRLAARRGLPRPRAPVPAADAGRRPCGPRRRCPARC